ncbi:chain length determinant protein EpsF [Cellvibrio sp. PSBB006]|uniref:chain length determinant protein EpsF n=1 Tax=Cellvibrio sp. PSBB006 TaxID=1987723 RepID=UPI000B3B54A7|nr:chain length determinant protein EpsF [Cellvibrio sp. PSBB006]ARU27799.1 chain length determinant protein EpsF [Cellvibrio sp. PSBB006]
MNLAALLRILSARWITIAGLTLIAVVVAGVVTLQTPKSYTAATELIIDGKGQDPISGESLPARMLSGYIATQADIIRSRNVANKVIDQLNLIEEPALQPEFRAASTEPLPSRGWLLYYLKTGLAVTPQRDSSVLSISFKARNPELAARIADAFAQAYIQTNLELRIEPAKQITQWYDLQLASLRENLVDRQNTLAAYQEEHNIIASSDRLDLESEKLAELSSMLLVVQGQRLDEQSRSKQLDGSKPGALPEHVLTNPQVQKISDELSQAQARMAEIGSQVGSNHPQYRQAQREVDALQTQLQRTLKLVGGSLRSSVELSQSREEQLKAEVAAQKEHVLQLNRNRNQLTLLRQEVDNAQAAYDAALARASQTKLESRIALTDVAILNTAAIPSKPTEPKPALNLLIAMVFGLLLGTAVALCWEWIDRRVRSGEELEASLGIPVLAYIPLERNWSKREIKR